MIGGGPSLYSLNVMVIFMSELASLFDFLAAAFCAGRKDTRERARNRFAKDRSLGGRYADRHLHVRLMLSFSLGVLVLSVSVIEWFGFCACVVSKIRQLLRGFDVDHIRTSFRRIVKYSFDPEQSHAK